MVATVELVFWPELCLEVWSSRRRRECFRNVFHFKKWATPIPGKGWGLIYQSEGDHGSDECQEQSVDGSKSFSKVDYFFNKKSFLTVCKYQRSYNLAIFYSLINWTIPDLFFVFSIQFFSGVWSNRPTNCTTTTAQYSQILTCIHSMLARLMLRHHHGLYYQLQWVLSYCVIYR